MHLHCHSLDEDFIAYKILDTQKLDCLNFWVISHSKSNKYFFYIEFKVMHEESPSNTLIVVGIC